MVQILKEKFLLKKDEILLGIALVLFIFAQVFEFTAFSQQSQIISTFTKIIRYIAYTLCVIRVLMHKKIKLSWFICIIAVAIVLFIGAITINSRTMFLYFWLVAASYGVSDKKLLRTVMYTQTIILIVTVVCSQIGIIEDFVYGDRMRHYLGFIWTTIAPILFFYIVLQYLYIYEFNISIGKFIVFMIINIWFFMMTNTRFTFALLSLTLVFALLYNRTFIHKISLNKIRYLFILSPEIIGIFSICLHAFYDATSSSWSALNSFLNGRLRLGYEALQQYGINLFGHQIKWYGNNAYLQGNGNNIVYNYVDCSYVQILLDYGLVFLILVLVAFSFIMAKAIKEKYYSACWIILIVLIFGITEPRLVNFAFCPFILLLMTKLDVLKVKDSRTRNLISFRIGKTVNCNIN